MRVLNKNYLIKTLKIFAACPMLVACRLDHCLNYQSLAAGTVGSLRRALSTLDLKVRTETENICLAPLA